MKKKNIIILIVVVCILLLGICGYIAYSKSLSKNNHDNSDNQLLSPKTVFTEEDFDDYVKSWLGLSVLTNKKSLSEMTNQEKLRMLIRLYQGEDKDTTFSQERLEEVHRGSVIKNLDVTYENLYDYFGTFSWNTNAIAYEYNEVEKTFKNTGALGHGAINLGDIAHSEIVSINKSDNKYIVKYRYIFYNNYGDGPTDEDLYLRASDAINKTNEWVHLNLDENNNTHRDEYINKHYNEIKEKLPIYTYTFIAEDNHLTITDFSVEEK